MSANCCSNVTLRRVSSALLTGSVLFIIAGTAIAQFTTVINSPPTIIGDGESIGSDTQLNVFDGGRVGNNFRAGDNGVMSQNIEINIFGGLVGYGFSTDNGSTVNISGGSVGSNFQALGGSTVNISGGSIDEFLIGPPFGGDVTANISGGSFGGVQVWDGNRVTISGGSFGGPWVEISGSTASISGGSFNGGYIYGSRDSRVTISGGSFDGADIGTNGAWVTISGGSIGGYLQARYNDRYESRVDLLGTDFFIDGTVVPNLTVGEPVIVTDRDVTLSGHFADGSPFSFELNSVSGGGDYFSPDATLTVTLVPEPSGGVLLLLGFVSASWTCLRRW